MADFDKVIPPGQEGKINLQVNGNKVHGTFSKSATVFSNDPEHPQMRLTLKGKEMAYVNVTPADRLYLQGYFGDPVEKTLTITSNEKDLDFKVTGVTSNIDDKITYRVEKGENRGEYRIKIWKNPKLPTMNTFGTVFIHTNSAKSPDKSIQVQVLTKGSITVRPSMVNFARVPFSRPDHKASPVTRSIVLIKPKGGFAVQSIEVDNDHFQAHLKEVDPGKRYMVEVTFNPPERRSANQREAGQMMIITNDPTEPRITVPLRAMSQ